MIVLSTYLKLITFDCFDISVANIILNNHLYLSFCSLGPVFALFVPFYSSIPRVQVTQVLGHFSITNKSLVYILGLQVWYVLACSSFNKRIT